MNTESILTNIARRLEITQVISPETIHSTANYITPGVAGGVVGGALSKAIVRDTEEQAKGGFLFGSGLGFMGGLCSGGFKKGIINSAVGSLVGWFTASRN